MAQLHLLENYGNRRFPGLKTTEIPKALILIGFSIALLGVVVWAAQRIPSVYSWFGHHSSVDSSMTPSTMVPLSGHFVER